MINLNDYTQEEKEIKIFNQGNAGRVENTTIQIVKKSNEDHERAPDYKINYVDSTGAMVNDAVYYPKDSDTDSQKQINMSRLISLLNAISPSTKDKMLPEFDNYVAAVDFLVKQIIAAAKTGATVNVFVCYGTKNNPQQYLRVRKFNFVEASSVEESSTRLFPKVNPSNSVWDDVMSRITPTTFNKEDGTTEDTDAGLDDW